MLEREERLSQADAVEDIFQLAQTLGEAHPDPYTALGGPLAFHRRVAEIGDAIPEGGVTRSQLLARLRPLVAALRDGHTAIRLPGAPLTPPSGSEKSGLPFEWDTASERVYIAGVYDEAHRGLLGTTLTAAGGVPFAELARRMGALRGFDNPVNNLTHLMEALGDRAQLADLLGAAEPASDQLAGSEEPGIAIDVVSADGASRHLLCPLGASGTPLRPESALSLPAFNAADLASGFSGAGGRVAYLRVGSLMRYREAFEVWRAAGFERLLGDHLTEVATAALGEEAPDDVVAKIAAVPSATETLTTLFAEMARQRTPALVVDLRESVGGNSFFASILAYFLYGVEGVIAADPGYQIPRHSPLYFANYTGTPEVEQAARLRNGGYDFTEEAQWDQWRREGLTAEETDRRRAEFVEAVGQSPTFASAVTTTYPGVTWPLEVIVVTAARTYSAGFDVAAQLVKHGGRVVGVASGQAGNCFIDTLRYQLPHSRLDVSISFKRSLLFPEDAERGALLRPEEELIYDQLAALNFDPHASVRLALEHVATRSAEPGPRLFSGAWRRIGGIVARLR
jgi:hypothetical protein